MLDETTHKEAPTFVRRKTAQWKKFAKALPGLQLVHSHNQFMLVYSTDDFYEGIVIGQLPQVQIGGKPLRIIAEAQRSLHKQRIDLIDDQIDAVMVYWQSGKSALELPFVKAVWNRDGHEVRK